MHKKFAITMLTMSAAMSTAALGNEIDPYDDPNILSPCGCGPVLVEWVSGDGDAPGTLSWLNPDIQNTPIALFDSTTASESSRVLLPRHYGLGERVDFSYTTAGNNAATMRTDVQGDWGQFVVVQESSKVYLVYVEDDNTIFSDDDLDDAVFRVSFCTVPAPGPSMLFGAGLAMMGLRRRR
ncbi:MAG: PEP-CTERM sorting domain-containing protein [Phycisphaerales bacterium]|nr:PEP-CTERM sorting domain-containing protein [Phycisphaerales bacterium]